MSTSSRSSLSPAPSPEQAAKAILNGRKCYRMSKDKNEVVWPPHLEAALMKGLDKYAPAESKSPRGLTRFPNRNKFIAEFILKETGVVRTAKQVGSRIQQLRDTTAGKSIMKAISDRHYEMMHPTRAPPSQDALGLAGMGMAAADMFLPGDVLLPIVQHAYISVPPASAPVPLAGSSRQTNVQMVGHGVYQWTEPRPLRRIDPTVAFKTPSLVQLYSSYRVCCGRQLMHVEGPTFMRLCGDGTEADGMFLYSSLLAPGFWDQLCSVQDLSTWTIQQSIARDTENQGPVTVMEVVYHFTDAPAPPLSPFIFGNADLDNIDYDTADDMGLSTPPAMSICSESPYPSDGSSSPSSSIPPGFASAPLSPVDWVHPHSHAHSPEGQWAYAAPATTQQQQQQPFSASASAPFPAGAYYGQPPQQHEAGGHRYLGPSAQF